jgi:uncharacterized protein (UPF0303 family)
VQKGVKKMSLNQKLAALLQEEEELQFTHFTNEMALEIGVRMIEIAKQKNNAITIDISRNGQQLFHYSFTGTSTDNNEWVKRKTNVVNRFGHNSYYMETFLRSIGKSIKERFYLEPAEYAASGGAFPIIVRNVGVVGSITVSGMKPDEDHDLVTSTLRESILINK